ncbi:AAA family ATPase [Prescottella agglutinans]|uniref:AAA family ATPase n=1 Tax=Prescottella agglutinans TaxID=1644129 RepID=A0ABT6MFV4_9NOCA|nr:AAA family ATPase [Prescottella agglutinans]MDH6283204.1 hypothetical protein [Prescottella agglutinans]
MNDSTTSSTDNGDPATERYYITTDDLPRSMQNGVNRLKRFAQDRGRPLPMPYMDPSERNTFEEFRIHFDCPNCRDDVVTIDHLGPPSSGIASMTCPTCDNFNPCTLAEEIGFEEDERLDFEIPNIVPEWDDEPPVVEPSAEERITAAMPKFDHPSQAVRDKARDIWVNEESRKLVADYRRSIDDSADLPFDAGTLEEMLEREPEPPNRIAGLVPADAGTIIVAARKTGKTTFVLNLAHSLISGQPFLNYFDVDPVAEDAKVAILNFEVSPAQAAGWADAVGIDRRKFFIVNLRGRRNPLGHEEDQARLAALLRQHNVEALIVDPFGRAFTGTDQNSSSEVGRWLVNLDLFAREQAGVRDVILPVHAGWNQERTRGASALEDWADSIINLTRDDNDRRYVRATGRDVHFDEDQLLYDPETHRLSVSHLGGREEERTQKKQAKKDERAETLLPYLVEGARRHPGYGMSELTQWLRSIKVSDNKPVDFRDEEMTAASRLAHERGLVRIELGARKKKQHFVTDAADGIAPWPPLPDDPTPGS